MERFSGDMNNAKSYKVFWRYRANQIKEYPNKNCLTKNDADLWAEKMNKTYTALHHWVVKVK